MRKIYIFGLVALACLIIGSAWADEMTLTTYYPAPYGVYNDLSVMNRLGIGTTNPSQKLDVAGGIQIGNIADANGEAGAIRWTGSDFQGHNGTAWAPLGANVRFLAGQVAETGTQSSSYTVPKTVNVVGFTPRGAICAAGMIGRWGKWAHWYCDPPYSISGNTVTFNLRCEAWPGADGDCLGAHAVFNFLIIGD